MSQWIITKEGLETVPPSPNYCYAIPAERLTELHPEEDLYMWPVHLSAKTWLDAEDFIRVFSLALERHGDVCGDVDWDRLAASYAVARQTVAGNQA